MSIKSIENRQFYLKNITEQNETHGKTNREKQAITDPKGKDKQYIKDENQRQKWKQSLIKAYEEEMIIAADNMKGI